jgi:hypothetical protein
LAMLCGGIEGANCDKIAQGDLTKLLQRKRGHGIIV